MGNPHKFIRVPNLKKWQHYKDRNPPWIKLHRDLLNNYDFSRLSDASKLHLIMIWILASQMDNLLPADPDWLAKRMNANSKVDLRSLIESGFVQYAINPLAECGQVDQGEREAKSKSEAETKYCPELHEAGPPALQTQPVVTIPLVQKNKTFTVSQTDIDQWQESFPGIDVTQELRTIRQWNIDNPKNRKTAAGIRKHISGWLAKKQDRARPIKGEDRRQPLATTEKQKREQERRLILEACEVHDDILRSNLERFSANVGSLP